jgi:hypothetical protein
MVSGIRMASVFTIVTSTILMRTRLMPRSLVASEYGIGIALLLTVGYFAWIELAFPAWVFALSVYILVAGHKRVRPVVDGETDVVLGRGV